MNRALMSDDAALSLARRAWEDDLPELIAASVRELGAEGITITLKFRSAVGASATEAEAVSIIETEIVSDLTWVPNPVRTVTHPQ